jgi:hypothetical protein
MEAVLILVVSWRMDSVKDEAMSHEQEFHGVDTFQDYASQGLAVHVLIWDPRGRVRDSSSLDGVYCVSHNIGYVLYSLHVCVCVGASDTTTASDDLFT